MICFLMITKWLYHGEKLAAGENFGIILSQIQKNPAAGEDFKLNEIGY